jgi:signal transduction histidine kinase
VFEDIIGEDVESSQVIDAAVNYLEREVKTISRSLPLTERKQIERSFLKATDAIRKSSESSQSELSHLRLIASTSTLLLIFSHEVNSLLGLLEQSKNSLSIIAKTLATKQKDTLNLTIKNFTDLKDRLEELLDLTSLVGKDLRRAKPGQVALRERIERVEKAFELIVKKYEIEIKYDNVPNNIVITRILEAELFSILLNVLSNSIKSVIAGGKNRVIEISAHREKGTNVIVIRDTGLGLDESQFEDVFTPFIADPDGKLYRNLERRLNPEDKLIVGSGSGLGLGIVKQIVNAHEGTVQFVKPHKNWNAELEIRLP